MAALAATPYATVYGGPEAGAATAAVSGSAFAISETAHLAGQGLKRFHQTKDLAKRSKALANKAKHGMEKIGGNVGDTLDNVKGVGKDARGIFKEGEKLYADTIRGANPFGH